ncbi:MAG: tetratricopeptide repeat protein [Myxococcota bacterium]|nr:tetratricopeptide repeat protein [Myxococcota bacterium]
MHKLVTIVHTDIQGSTRLWEQAPQAMRAALERHDQIQRALIAAHHGYEIRTEGDAFLNAFEHPSDAFAYALALQENLLDAAWPDELLALPDALVERNNEQVAVHAGPRVRVGIMQGAAEHGTDDVTGRRTYQGATVNRCVALASAAHGGQVVTDLETWRSLTDTPWTHRELGHLTLPGQLGVVDVIQVSSQRLEGRRFDPLRGAARARTNLSSFENATIGHQPAVNQVQRRFEQGTRCVLLCGAPGVGKSRVAREAALQRLTQLEQCWSIDLAECVEQTQLLRAAASALSLPTARYSDEELIDRLGQALRGRGATLLLLDNTDRCADAVAAVVPRWLDQAPALCVLVTSRRVVAIEQSETQRLAPLSEAHGLELFTARATERGATLPTDTASAEACLAIVKALDGIPLAIELAASRIGVLGPVRMAKRLHQRFKLLQTRNRDDHRQGTLATAIEWSWETLSDEQARCLEALSVFHEGFDLPAASAVIDMEPHDLDERLDELCNQSMIQSVSDAQGKRYALLQSIRLFAADRLRAAGREETLKRAHYRYFGDRGEAIFLSAQQTALEHALSPIRTLRANLLAAIEHSADLDPQSAAGAALGLVPLLFTQGPINQGNAIFTRLAAAQDRIAPGRRTLFLTTLARVHRTLGDAEACVDAIERARALVDHTDDPVHEALVLDAEIRLFSSLGETERAVGCVRRALNHLKTHAMPAHEAKLHSAIGNVYYNLGRTDDALEAFESAGRGFTQLDMPFHAARALGNAGMIHLAQQRFQAAEEHFTICLKQYAQARHVEDLARTHLYLGALALDRERLDDAELHYREAAETAAVIAAPETTLVGRGFLAVIAQLRGRFEQAQLRYDEALASAQRGTPARIEGHFRCYYGGLLAQLGRHTEAQQCWARAQALEQSSGDASLTHLLELTQAQAWLGVPERSEELNALKQAMRTPDASGTSLAGRSEDIRIALRLLESR